jgi:hypothetical protein
MAKGNAESFDDVLELARTRQYTGTVAVEHTQGGRVEGGEVFFQRGQPIQARVGYLVGQDALNRLMKWHSITCAFETDESLQSATTTTVKNGNNATFAPTHTRTYVSQGPVAERTQVNGRDALLSNTSSPGVEWLVPQKRGIESDVLALPLTRRQRFIYFLVDGRRTVADLARCTSKNTREIELILSELQEQGLVAV